MPSPQPSVLGLTPSFGFGDRLGCATAGHVRALQKCGEGIAPIFAQQSVREMTRTGRSPDQVMRDAVLALTQKGYEGAWGADADHLKTPQDAARLSAAGFTFFTIDPSDFVDADAHLDPAEVIDRKFAAVYDEVKWVESYKNRLVRLGTGKAITLDENTLHRAGVKYGRAVNHAVMMSKEINTLCKGRAFEIELSIDETPQPTTLAEHFIIAERCLSQGMKLVSLAPRFLGDFEKGVDYKGDLNAFERSLHDHAAIAQTIGPYKLSLHSGSDKLSIYTAFARITGGKFHVKTAGTSYLEALRVAARAEEDLFREIVEFSRSRYEQDRATYHVSADLSAVPPPQELRSASRLEREYLGLWKDVERGRGFTEPGRQILHVTFGSVVTHEKLGPALREVLSKNLSMYDELLEEHFSRHLDALKEGMVG
jgi:hypothetical protein